MTQSSTTQVRGVSYLYMAAAFVIVVAGMRAAESILNPLLLAIFLSVISAPAYFGLLKRGVSNWLALLTVIGALAVILFSVVMLVTKSIAGFTAQQDHYIDRWKEERKKIISTVDSWVPEWARSKAEEKTESGESEVDSTNTPDPVDAVQPDDDLPKNQEPVTGTPDAADDSPSPRKSDDDHQADGRNESESTQENGEVVEDEDLSATSDINHNEKESDDEDSRLANRLGFPVSQQPSPKTEQSWRDYMSEQFDPATAIAFAAVVVSSLGQILGNAFLILLTVIFILLEAGSFTKKMNEAFTRTEDATARAKEIVESLQHYIVIKTWVSLATGISISLWLMFLGVSHAPLWGLLAFLFNYIPNVGSILAAVPAVLIAWLDLGWQPAVACAIGFLLVNAGIGNFIEPRLMGNGLGLSVLVVFCSMVFWGWVLGPIGMVLSVPLTMTARIVLDGFEDTKWIATLMGNAQST